MNHDNYPDTYIRGILNTVKTIAMVGVSPKDNRPSYFAFKYLLERGYRMIPVNPGQAGKEILGQKVYAKLADIPEPVDMVDVFRASQFAAGVVDEALAMKPQPAVIWMQLGVRNDAAAAKAEAAGLKVVMNRCPKIEYGRLSSEIGWIGVNSRTLSSKRAPLLGKGVQRMSLNRSSVGRRLDASRRPRCRAKRRRCGAKQRRRNEVLTFAFSRLNLNLIGVRLTNTSRAAPRLWRGLMKIQARARRSRFSRSRPLAASAETQDEQNACMNDAFNVCGHAIPDRDRVGGVPGAEHQPHLAAPAAP